MEAERAKIILSLEPLFDKARAEGLWFFSTYQDLWFSPDELQEQHELGQFIWGPVNWQLIDPEIYKRQLEKRLNHAQQALDDFLERYRGDK